MENDIISQRELSISKIAVYTATGNLDSLKNELNTGLDTGFTINEIKEILIHLYAYCGFPRSLQGLNSFMEVLEERKSKGINDPEGEEPTPVTGENKYERGKQTLETLAQVKLTHPTGTHAFAPGIDTFLKEHLFADIFGRGVLSYSEREIATVSALIALGGVDPMLQSHINICMNTGVKEEQLREIIKNIQTLVSTSYADNAYHLLDVVVKNRAK